MEKYGTLPKAEILNRKSQQNHEPFYVILKYMFYV